MTQAVTLAQLASSGALSADTNGNVGIGTSSPDRRLSVSGSGSTQASSINVKNTTQNQEVQLGCSNASTDSFLNVGTNTALYFGTNNTERARITSGGDFLVGATATVNNALFYVNGSVSDRFVRFRNTNANPYGQIITYSGGASPNGTSNEFILCEDNSANRMTVRSNGGIANFSANNVNLSDRREKTNFAPAKNYLDVICAIPVQTFNYIDQNMEDDPGLTLGVVAQDVQEVAPEMVMESNWGTKEEPKMRLSIYQTDLQYALMKCIQEQQQMIETLQAEVALLKGAA
jgi:hypothetical protein